MKFIIYLIFLSITLSLGCLASKVEDKDYATPWSNIPQNNRLYGDIDGDDKNDIVVWKKSQSSEYGDFYRIYIYNTDGNLLWKSPSSNDADKPYTFGAWDFGISLPEVLIDIDLDKEAELLVPAPISDVSPQYYRILKWNGHTMAEEHPSVLMLSKDDKNRFIWVNPFPGDGTKGVWVAKLYPFGDSIHKATADIFYINGSSVVVGKALLQFDRYGAKIIKWIIPISKPNSYIARISQKDHYNSYGKRLIDIRAVLHQDRANFYKGYRDKEDTSTGIFKTTEARNRIDNMKIESVNIPYQKLSREIINSNPLLKITVFNDKLQIEIIKNKK